MAKCVRCSRSGLTLSLDSFGHCPDCQSIIKRTTDDQLAKMSAELEILRKFHAEYAIIPDSKVEADRIVTEAKAEAERLVTEAQNNADAMLKDATTECARMREEIDAHRVSSELSAQKKVAKAQDELHRIETDSKLVVSDTEARLAALFASAAGDFMHLAKSTASTAYSAERKYAIKTKLHTDSRASFNPLSPVAFKKAAASGYIVFDFETTGLSRTNDEIVEIGAILFDSNHMERARYSKLVKPSKPIPAAASAVNGITDSMVADAPSIADVLPRFLEFIGSYPLIAHNADFDIAFLRNAVENANMTCSISYADSISMCKRCYDLSSYKLSNVAAYLGYPRSQTHRSMGDCDMLAYVVRNLLS